jgi:hypothetical protein
VFESSLFSVTQIFFFFLPLISLLSSSTFVVWIVSVILFSSFSFNVSDFVSLVLYGLLIDSFVLKFSDFKALSMTLFALKSPDLALFILSLFVLKFDLGT